MLRGARLVLSLLVLGAMAVGCSAHQDQAGLPTEPVFLTGTILKNGEPVENADVTVRLQDERAAANAEVGDSIRMLTADEARTDSAGMFTLRVDPAEVPTNFFLGGHDRSLLNYELIVTTPLSWVPWGSSMHWTDDVWRSEEGLVAADQPVALEVDLGTERLSITDSVGESTSHEAAVFEPHH